MIKQEPILVIYDNNLTRCFNFTFRYIADAHSLNKSTLDEFVDRLYPIEFEIKDTTDTARSASYLDLRLNSAER